MDLLFVKGKKNMPELAMAVLAPVLLAVLDYVLVKNYGNKMNIWQLDIPAVQIVFGASLFLGLITGIASYRIKLASPQSSAHIYYALQLFLCFLWQLAFFRFMELRISLLTVILYLIFVCAAFFEFEKIDKRAGLLMLPAVLWALALSLVTFLVQ